MNKAALIETLHAWINQRPGLEPANYMRGWNDTPAAAHTAATPAA
jgi:hypothetical protein